jgi:hypothetical protein
MRLEDMMRGKKLILRDRVAHFRDMAPSLLKGKAASLLVMAIVAGPTFLWGDAGTSGGLILNTPIGARAIAMGEAYVAQADDVSSLYWNPAGLGLLNQSQASFMYNQSVQGLSFNNMSIATPLEYGGIGASLSYLSYGKIDGYDAQDNPTGNVTAYSGAATLGAAFFSGESWAMGMNIKGVEGALADVKANGVAADLGLTYVHPTLIEDGTLRLAATVRNLGTGLQYIDQNDPFPLEFRVGAAAVQMLDRKLNISVDVSKLRDEPVAGYTGAEYWIVPQIALRAGWVASNQEGTGLRAGVGLKVNNISFDYAFSSYGELGMSNLFETTIRFGTIRPTLTPEERELLRRGKLALARQQDGEATLLFNSLYEMEPNYRPVKRLLDVAMKGFEGQELALKAIGKPFHVPSYQGSLNAAADPELQDLTNLIEGDNTQTAENLARPSSTQTSTLASYIPGQDPTQPLKASQPGEPKP